MAKIHVQLDLTVPFFAARTLLAAGALFLCAGELNSESVMLTTYYPAPSGIYTRLIATDNTLLARDVGFVGIRTSVTGSILSVKGNMSLGTYSANAAPANGLIVSGQVGMGTATPETTAALHVVGSLQIGNSSTFSRTSGNNYLYIDNSAPTTTCILMTTAGAACASTQYATWVPGIYMNGQAWYGGQGVAVSGSPVPSTLSIVTSIQFYCCPR